MLVSQIPDEITNNSALNDAISRLLPANYTFEVHKSIHMIRQNQCQRVALQLPEGLQMFAMALSTIFQQFAYYSDRSRKLDTVVLADVTYGACCVDDFTAKALGCDLLIHYGHSCLVPVTKTTIKTLYVFVSIEFALQHLVETILLNFPQRDTHLYLLGTIQFSAGLPGVLKNLTQQHGYSNVTIPQIKPLSPGEVLGCTSPRLDSPPESSLVLYVGDGRFHLESIMIQNPHLAQRFFRYDPYQAKLTHEQYDYSTMLRMRRDAIEQARLPAMRTFGLLVGTLGRQGNLDVVHWIRSRLEQAGKRVMTILVSEISVQKLRLFDGSCDVFIQTSCPRLSIDWGYAFDKPLLTPYEAMLALLPHDQFEKQRPAWMSTLEQDQTRDCECGESAVSGCSSSKKDWDRYPMDFYAKDSLGPWTPNHVDPVKEEEARRARRERLMHKLNKSRQQKQQSE